ncbi:hypothetical protein BaRGS_00002753 [Batillaria attramentaria]|uniref:Uncharacterized protein n=1 Tax=Batillaria attramentaria TaxID=370345 RepID=A0ABD0M3E4_9CAEN
MGASDLSQAYQTSAGNPERRGLGFKSSTQATGSCSRMPASAPGDPALFSYDNRESTQLLYSLHQGQSQLPSCSCPSAAVSHNDHDDNLGSSHHQSASIFTTDSVMEPETRNCNQETVGRCRHHVSWSCRRVARAVFLLTLMTSCLGVSLARPLSDSEKQYREMQSRAVVSCVHSFVSQNKIKAGIH